MMLRIYVEPKLKINLGPKIMISMMPSKTMMSKINQEASNTFHNPAVEQLGEEIPGRIHDPVCNDHQRVFDGHHNDDVSH